MDKKLAILKLENIIDEIKKTVGEEKYRQVGLIQTVGLIINTMEGLEQYKKYAFDIFRTRHVLSVIIDNIKDKIGSLDLTDHQSEKLIQLSYEINKTAFGFINSVNNQFLEGSRGND